MSVITRETRETKIRMEIERGSELRISTTVPFLDHMMTTLARYARLAMALEATGDLASDMVDGIDRFLLQQIEETGRRREARWVLDTTSPAALQQALLPHRKQLASALGVRDERVSFAAPEVLTQAGHSPVIASTEAFEIVAVRWPVLAEPAPQVADLTSVWGEGLLLVPRGEHRADVIVIPDADHLPEQLWGSPRDYRRGHKSLGVWLRLAAGSSSPR